jgi:YVTN family beta-propeller protein
VANQGLRDFGGSFMSTVSVYTANPFAFVRDLGAGNASTGVAYDPENGAILVTNAQSNTVWSYNASTYAVQKVGVGSGPAAIAYDAAAHVVVVANLLSENLTVLGAASLNSVGSVNLSGSVPTGLAVGSDGLVYVGQLSLHAVAVVDVSSLIVRTPIGVGPSPISLAIDPATQVLYTAGSGTGANVTEFNLTSSSYVGAVPLFDGTHWVTDSVSQGRMVVANTNWGNVTLVSTSTHLATGSVTLGASPLAVAADPTSGALFSGDYESGTIASVDVGVTAVSSVGRSVSGSGTQFVAYDTLRDTFWWGGPGSHLLTVVYGPTQSITNTVDSGVSVGPMAYDVSDDRMYVAVNGGNQIVPIGASSGYPDPGVTAVNGPISMEYDPWNGFVYEGSGQFNSVSVTSPIAIINGSTEHVLRTVTGGGVVSAFATDPENGQIYAFNLLSNNVTVIDGTTNQVVKQIPILIPGSHEAAGAVYDPVTGLIYATEPLLNAVTMIDPSTDTVVGDLSVGVGPQGIAYDYSGGFVVVSNLGSGTLSILRDPGRYAVTFHPVGLLGGVTWGVVAQRTVEQSPAADITYYAQNGTLAWQIQKPAQFDLLSSAFGNATISGADLVIPVTFQANGTRYPVQFYERGLPFQQSWSVHILSPNITKSGKSQLIVLSMINGSYNYTIPGVAGYLPLVGTGNFTVNGSLVNITVQWNQALYPLQIAETGLPNGTSWGISLQSPAVANFVVHLTTSSGSAASPNGTYHYTALTVPGYNATPSVGVLVINGTPVWLNFTFKAVESGGTGGFLGSTSNLNGVLALGIILLALILIALAVVVEWRERRAAARAAAASDSPAPVTPPATEGSEPPEPGSGP